jgi:hypothetical protein
MLRGMDDVLIPGGTKPLPGKRMTLAQCRKVAPELNDLSDEALLELRDLAYQFAELLFDAWHQERLGSKNPPEHLTKRGRLPETENHGG